MENKKLGRGLEQLFNNEVMFNDGQGIDLNKLEQSIQDNTKKEDIVEIKLSELRANPYQPRKTFDEESLNELAKSIKEYGVLQPIIVRKSIKGYDIIAGERRSKASEIAGLKTIPAIVKDFTDAQMMEVALLENIQRENLTVIEEAEAYKNIIDELGITQENLGKKLGKSRSHITNMLGLLRLPDNVKKLVNSGSLSMGHARAISKVEDSSKMSEIAEKVVTENLTVRDVEEIVSGDKVEKKNPIVKKQSNNEYALVQRVLREKIGTMVKVGNRKIEIPFDSEADLERILKVLKIEIKED